MLESPDGHFSGRALLLTGDYLTREGEPKRARDLFSDFAQRFPNSSLLGEVRLALVRTYFREQNWTAAIAVLEKAAFTNLDLVPQAEFFRALALWHAGDETNALNLMTNLVAQFPSNAVAAVAQNWVADFYFNNDQLAKAEENYQTVFQKFSATNRLAFQARYMAGRAAFERGDFAGARVYFSALVNDTNTPPELLMETYGMLGEAFGSQFLASTNKSEEDFRDIIAAFSKIKDTVTNSLAAHAWGRIGDFQLQWALLKTNSAAFIAASDAYSAALKIPDADIACRTQAKVGLAQVLEKQKQIGLALDQYLLVLYENDGEPSDPTWLRTAGISAAAIYESLENWSKAETTYNQLKKKIPSLAAAIDKRIEALKKTAAKPPAEQTAATTTTPK